MPKRALLILAIILAVFLFIVFLKGITNENDWICQDGKWIKHGNPQASKPALPCQ